MLYDVLLGMGVNEPLDPIPSLRKGDPTPATIPWTGWHYSCHLHLTRVTLLLPPPPDQGDTTPATSTWWPFSCHLHLTRVTLPLQPPPEQGDPTPATSPWTRWPYPYHIPWTGWPYSCHIPLNRVTPTPFRSESDEGQRKGVVTVSKGTKLLM